MNIITKTKNSIRRWWSKGKSVELRNFRAYTINNTQIYAMAKPSPTALHQLGHHNINHIIALTGEAESAELRSNYQNLNNCSWDHFITEDFTVPRPEKFEEFNQLLNKHLEDGKTVVVHCGAGSGRTGTYIAGYWLKKTISSRGHIETQTMKYEKRLSIFDTRHFSYLVRKVYHLLLKVLFGYSAKQNLCDPDVWQVTVDALDFVKENAPSAVETPAQLQALQNYAKNLYTPTRACL